MAKSVVVLPVAAGTNSVGILKSYTHGFRASGLAKVRSQMSMSPPYELSLRMRAVTNVGWSILQCVFHQQSGTCMCHHFVNVKLLVCPIVVFDFECVWRMIRGRDINLLKGICHPHHYVCAFSQSYRGCPNARLSFILYRGSCNPKSRFL